MEKKNISILKELGYLVDSEGGKVFGNKIASILGKPKTNGEKFIYDGISMLIGYGLTKVARKKNDGELSESDRRKISGIQRALHRKVSK